MFFILGGEALERLCGAVTYLVGTLVPRVRHSSGGQAVIIGVMGQRVFKILYHSTALCGGLFKY